MKNLLLILTLFVVGCATTQVEREFTTISGHPEVTIDAPIEDITSYILEILIDKNYMITNQTPNLLELERPLTDGEEFTVSLLLGNSYSNNSRISKINFIKTPNGTRLIWRQFYKAVMPLGNVNQQEIMNNNMFNEIMYVLQEMKFNLE